MRCTSARLALCVVVLACAPARVRAQLIADPSAVLDGDPTLEAAGCTRADLQRLECSSWIVNLRARFGAANGPYITPAFPNIRGHGVVAELSGLYRLNERWLLGARFPLAFISVAQPAGSYVDQTSSGNPNLIALHGGAFQLADDVQLQVYGVLTLGLPVAQQGPPGSLLGARALAVANALEAYRDQAAFTPGTLPIAPAAGVRVFYSWLDAEFRLELPLFVSTSHADLPDDARTHAVGFMPVLHFGTGARLARWFSLALATDLVISAVRPVETTRNAARAQFSVAPALLFRLHDHVLLRADFVAPVGGVLGGGTYSGNLQLLTLW